MHTKKHSQALFLSSLVILASCSNINPKDATKLANEGHTLTSTVKSSYQGTRSGYTQYNESQVIVSAFGKKPLPSEKQKKEMVSSQLAILAREQVLNSLDVTYKSFSALASYDAAGEVEESINGLGDSINSYRLTVSPEANPISKVTGLITSKTGGLIASEKQKKKLKASSELIRQRLEAFAPLLAEDIAIQKQFNKFVVLSRKEAAEQLINEGLGDPQQLLTGQLSHFGLDSKSTGESEWLAQIQKSYTEDIIKFRNGTTKKAPETPPIYTAMKQIVELRSTSEVTTQEAILNEIMSSIEDLIDDHVRFEKGEDLSTESITQRIILIRQLLEEIKIAKSTN